MVTEFSGYAKLPELELVPGDLPALLGEVVGTFATAHRDISWTLETDPAQPPLPFDAEGLRKVFINLLTNAAEALEGQENGEVAVRAACDPARGVARVSVADNGPGFSQEERARMFEPYFSRKKTGTGLGLTIVRSIVMDHKGQVRVEAARPRGSVFVVELPLA
jgi:two-component system nitrogen regulation sensor histidine kinase NtrY